MAYGTLKIDNITYTNAGVDASTTVSGLVQGQFPNLTITGTISGTTYTGNTADFTTLTAVTGVFTSTLSGATVTGTTANFQSGVFTTQVSGATVAGPTHTGTTANFQSGVFTTQVSGATVAGPTHTGTTANFSSGNYTGTLSGATVTGNTGQFTNVSAGGGNFTSVTGTTVTGTTANFVSGVFTTQVSGATITGTNFGVGTGGIRFADGTTQTGAVSTANLATLTGAQTFTGGQRGSVVTVAYATGIALNLSSGNNFQITLTGNTTLQNPTSLASGQAGVVTIIQGSSGNTMSFATGWQYPGGSGSVPTLTATSGAVDLLVYYVKDTSSVAYRLVQNVKA
jgi:hypothetical protein